MATSLHTTLTSTSSSVETHSFGIAPGGAQRSPWHSPVPYLFGGLAAMLGLIAFALLILACSYWRLSREQENQQNNEDLEKGEGVRKVNGPPVYEEKIVVIMAGNDMPTFLANPVNLFLNHPSSNDHHLHNHVDNKPTFSEDESSASSVNGDGDGEDDKPKEDDQIDQNDQH